MTDALVEVPGQTVARVAVEGSLPHLDRPFDYAVPASLAGQVVPGCRVKVRFAGTLRDGWVLELAETSAFDGELDRIHKVVSPERALLPATQALIRAVADHYAGVWWDVARLAVPPRHAATEQAPQRPWPKPAIPEPTGTLASQPLGEPYLRALEAGGTPRAAWQVRPAGGGDDALRGAVEATAACLASHRSAVVVVPTARELERVVAHFRAAFGARAVATLASEQGRAARYRQYLACTRGEARIVVGTRSAVFAPVRDPGLIVVLDEGSDHHVERRAPYFHARTVAILRASLDRCALLLASHARSVDVEALVQRGWLGTINDPPSGLRALVAPVHTVSDVDRERDPSAARLRIPSRAFRFLRTQLPVGPVLVQVPARGFAAALACARCHQVARCPRCTSVLRARRRDEPECTLCGHRPVRWSCPNCHATTMTTPRPGAARTAEELARAFPGVLAVNSSADRLRDEVPDEPAIVVATPGAEPRASGPGYAGLVILDADATLARADFRASEEAIRRWSNALALVRPAPDGGRALIVGAHTHPAVQAMARLDAIGFARSELALRGQARLSPAVRTARVGGEHDAVRDFLHNVAWEDVEVLGPTEVAAERWAVLLRADLERGREFVAQVKAAAAIRSAKKQGGVLHYRVDPEVLE